MNSDRCYTGHMSDNPITPVAEDEVTNFVYGTDKAGRIWAKPIYGDDSLWKLTSFTEIPATHQPNEGVFHRHLRIDQISFLANHNGGRVPRKLR